MKRGSAHLYFLGLGRDEGSEEGAQASAARRVPGGPGALTLHGPPACCQSSSLIFTLPNCPLRNPKSRCGFSALFKGDVNGEKIFF